MATAIDMNGLRVGRLLIIERAPNHGVNASVCWSCRCDCGTPVVVSANHLRSGHTKSCGCLSAELSRKRRTRHGRSRTTEYRVWRAMHDRCERVTDTDFKNYGARNIRVCERWNTFESFFADMGERPRGHSLDRRDNSKGYSPDNCRWATDVEQANNRRCNVTVTVGETVLTAAELARALGIPYHTARRRILAGQTFEELQRASHRS